MVEVGPATAGNAKSRRKPRTPTHKTVEQNPMEYVGDDPPIVESKPVDEAKPPAHGTSTIKLRIKETVGHI